MGCSVMIDHKPTPEDNLHPNAMEDKTPHRIFLGFSSVSPGLALDYKGSVGILVSPDDCKSVAVKIVHAVDDRQQYLESINRIQSLYIPTIYAGSPCPSKAMIISFELHDDKKALLISGRFFERYHVDVGAMLEKDAKDRSVYSASLRAAVISSAAKGWLAKSCDTSTTSQSRLAEQRSSWSTLLSESMVGGSEKSVIKRGTSHLPYCRL